MFGSLAVMHLWPWGDASMLGGTTHLTAQGFMPNGFSSVITALLGVMFAYMGAEIGKYWNEQITKGKGSSYNCNRNQYPEHGIGMLEHNDIEKRKKLDSAIAYLSKDEQHIDLLSDKKEKSFVRGTLPKNKGNIGRPRKESKE